MSAATPSEPAESGADRDSLEAGRKIAARGMFGIAAVYVLAALALLGFGWETLKPLVEGGNGNGRIYLLLGMEALLLIAGNWLLIRSGIWVKELATAVAALAMIALIGFQLWGYLLGNLKALDFLAFALYEGTLLVALFLVAFMVKRVPRLAVVSLVFPLLTLIVLVQTYRFVFNDPDACIQTPVILGYVVLALTSLVGFVLIVQRSAVFKPEKENLFKPAGDADKSPSLFKPNNP